MNDKTDLIFYRSLDIDGGWKILVDGDNRIFVLKDEYEIDIEGLTGINVHDLPPDISIEAVLKKWEEEVGEEKAKSVFEGIKKGFMYIVGSRKKH